MRMRPRQLGALPEPPHSPSRGNSCTHTTTTAAAAAAYCRANLLARHGEHDSCILVAAVAVGGVVLAVGACGQTSLPRGTGRTRQGSAATPGVARWKCGSRSALRPNAATAAAAAGCPQSSLSFVTARPRQFRELRTLRHRQLSTRTGSSSSSSSSGSSSNSTCAASAAGHCPLSPRSRSLAGTRDPDTGRRHARDGVAHISKLCHGNLEATYQHLLAVCHCRGGGSSLGLSRRAVPTAASSRLARARAPTIHWSTRVGAGRALVLDTPGAGQVRCRSRH